MVLYVSAICMNSEELFYHQLRKNNFFKFKPDWHILFSQPDVFKKLQTFPICTSERQQLDIFVMKAALEKEL